MNIQSRFLVLVMEIERMTGNASAREVFSLIGLGRSVKITCGLFYKIAISSLKTLLKGVCVLVLMKEQFAVPIAL